jgi:fumarylacetoacetase
MTDSILSDATNDPQRRSWVTSANRVDGDFPIQNLPFAVFRPRRSGPTFRGGVAIGDQIVDLAAMSEAGILSGEMPLSQSGANLEHQVRCSRTSRRRCAPAEQ